MTNVFTYGSLMYPEVFTRVAQTNPAHVAATLSGWSRHAIANRTYPAAMPSAGACITGIVWRDLTEHALQRLDMFEGDEYVREEVLVRLNDGLMLPAQIYRWLDRDAVLPFDWSSENFERLHLQDFFRIHGS